MVREKRIYQLFEREPRKLSWWTLWNKHRFAVLLGVAIALSILLGGVAGQPGFHIVGTLILMDIAAFRHPTRWGGHQALVLILIHLFGFLTMAVGNRFMQETTVGVYLLFLILLFVFPRKDGGGF